MKALIFNVRLLSSQRLPETLQETRVIKYATRRHNWHKQKTNMKKQQKTVSHIAPSQSAITRV